MPYYKLVYGDFIYKYQHLNINWGTQANSVIFKLINDYVYGGLTCFRDYPQQHNETLIKYLNCTFITGEMRDLIWLTVHGRLPVRGVVKWSCFVKTVECPMPNCYEKETIGHLLIDCYRSIEIWQKMYDIGLTIARDRDALYANFNTDEQSKKVFWLCICLMVLHIWKTRCKMSTENIFISSEVVFKHIKTELKRRKTLDKKRTRPELEWCKIVL